MKRQGKLIDSVADMENLYLAYYKAQRGKLMKPSVLGYSKNLEENLKLLQKQIVEQTVEIGNYHYFTIYDPKKRTICASPFPQRVLHHALMNVCHPFFEKAQIFQSYASRIDKGTYAALAQAKKYQYRYKWFLKLDFRKYFDSINHDVLKIQIRRMFKDKQLLYIFDEIIDSYEVGKRSGVPIGNLTSQYFANHYLCAADHYAKEKLHEPAYVRYMDDIVMWHNSKEALLEVGKQFQHYTAQNLLLTLKPFCLNKNTKGLPFLGYLLYPNLVRLAQRSKKRFIQKSIAYQEKLESGVWSQQEYQAHAMPLISFTEHASAKAFRKKFYQQYE